MACQSCEIGCAKLYYNFEIFLSQRAMIGDYLVKFYVAQYLEQDPSYIMTNSDNWMCVLVKGFRKHSHIRIKDDCSNYDI